MVWASNLDGHWSPTFGGFPGTLSWEVDPEHFTYPFWPGSVLRSPRMYSLNKTFSLADKQDPQCLCTTPEWILAIVLPFMFSITSNTSRLFPCLRSGFPAMSLSDRCSGCELVCLCVRVCVCLSPCLSGYLWRWVGWHVVYHCCF